MKMKHTIYLLLMLLAVVGKPFCVYGMPHWDLKYSHCWNIDGYKIKEQKITTNRYVNNKLEGTSVTYKRVNMVHCDFGWSGQYNGYYISGLFKQMGNEWESDGRPIYEKPHNYDTYLHIMTYDL